MILLLWFNETVEKHSVREIIAARPTTMLITARRDGDFKPVIFAAVYSCRVNIRRGSDYSDNANVLLF
jgi:hypothetical protein